MPLMHFFYILPVALFFTFSWLLHGLEDPHGFLLVVSKVLQRPWLVLAYLLDISHFLLVDPENTTHTYYTMKHNKYQ